jgi:chromosome segregation ATPase
MISPFFRKKGTQEGQEDRSQELAKQEVASTSPEEPSAPPTQSPQESIFIQKSRMDKKSLDLVLAVEQMIQAKQHTEMQNSELQDRLTHSGGNIDRLNRDVKHLTKVIDEREKSILDLEQKIVDKNMKVDQLAEDYRELERRLTSEIEELKSVIELEKQKYISLQSKHNDVLADKNKRMHELEEKVNRQEVEHQHLKQKYETTHQEKVYLANMISDFTNRMSAPIGREG